MKVKPYSVDQIQEFETMTADLSLEAKGAWVTLRMRLCALKVHFLDINHERLGRLLRCGSEKVTTVLKEFELASGCGLRVEKPPCTDGCTDRVRIVYESDEKCVLTLTSESLRVSKYREYKSKKERKRMPEEWNLSVYMRDYAKRYGMSTDTTEHEFQHCKTHHLDSEFTDRGWESQVWQTWVLNWVKFGRKQVVSEESVWK